MNAKVKRAELLKAAKNSAVIAPAASPMETLKAVLVEFSAEDSTVSLTATNLDVSLKQVIPCETDSDDSFIIGARLFAAMLGKLPGDIIEISHEENGAIMSAKGDSTHYELPVHSAKAFPETAVDISGETVKVKGIPTLMKRISFAAQKGGSDPLLRCVDLRFTKDGLKAACSNGTCVISALGDRNSKGEAEYLIPISSLNMLSRVCTDRDEFAVGSDGKSVVFSKENMLFSSRLMEGNYIDIDRLTGSIKNSFTILADMKELGELVLSTATIEPEGKMQLCFRGNELTIKTEGMYGKAENSMGIIALSGTPHGECWYFTKQLLNCLDALSGVMSLGIAQGSMLTLCDEEVFYLQSAARPPEIIRKEKTADMAA